MRQEGESSVSARNSLEKYLVPFFRWSLALCMVGILTRRLYLSGAFDSTFIVRLPDLALRCFNVLESFLESVGLLCPPVELMIWFVFVQSGRLKKPHLYDYILLILTYTVAIGYLPSPSGHGLMHFGP